MVQKVFPYIVYACNICDEGFDYNNKVKEHMMNVHKEQIEFMLTESSKCTKEEE